VIVFLNGKFVPEEQATVSVFDRAFLYGDGLFETMRVVNGKPFRWWDHMERLRKGGDFLGIKIPFGCKSLEKFAAELIAQNKMPDALMRLTVSRGVGPRGYSPKGADKPTLVMTMHPAPVMPKSGSARWKLVTASLRLPAGDALAQFKTANKLAQVLARAEADAAGADEAVLLNTDGHVVEGASSNLFWIEGKTVCTPPLTDGLLAGVTRAVTIEICQSFSLSVLEKAVTPEQLRRADGIFLTLSSIGVAEAIALDGASLTTSPIAADIHRAYEKLLLES
jgi:aminodeoxychorismate lyase